jgi:hypothetical protein
MRRAMCRPVVEPSLTLKGRLRPDILCRDLALGNDMCFDLAVTCPLQSKYVAAAQRPLHAARDYACKIKDRKYFEACKERGYAFTAQIIWNSVGSGPQGRRE